MLSAWSSWGAIPDIFDSSKTSWESERAELRELLTDEQWRAAELTTLNAHFTQPAIVNAMWTTMRDLGVEDARVLEPGCGSGNFIGLAPEGMAVTGVELDPTTARIAAHLYPDAEVRAESFADTLIAPGMWGAAIGNVPFSSVKLVDPAWNPGPRFAMHNHFLRKSMAGLHTGGIGVMMTSMWSMDARNPAFRAEFSKEADLLGAVRLPAGAHQRTAGTDAVTDILVFRKRDEGEEASSVTREWVTTSPVQLESANGDPVEVEINDYFLNRPDHVLGRLGIGGQFQRQTVIADADNDTMVERLSERLSTISAAAIEDGLVYRPAQPGTASTSVARPVSEDVWDGTVVSTEDGIARVYSGELVTHEVAKKHLSEVRSLIELRDRAVSLVRLQLETSADTDDMLTVRQEALDAWRQHVQRFGPINRYTERWTTRTRIDDATGEREKIREPVRRRPAAALAMKSDPMWALTTALEKFNDETQTAEPAEILVGRTVYPDRPLLGADTAEEALTLSVEQVGRADLDRIASLLGTDRDTARAELDELVFDDPSTGGLVPRTDYLSGNVRTKLEVARSAHEEEPERGYDRNVAALEAVIPEDVPMEDIDAMIGAVWIPEADHRDFFVELTGDADVTIRCAGPGVWHVKPGTGARQSIRAISEWGTERKPAHDLYRAMLTGASIQVFDEHKDSSGTTRTLNTVETEAAREKAEAIAERFGEWVWEDPSRADRLHREYQHRFNSLVMRDYSEDGERLTLPGLAKDFIPHPHQRTAVARIVGEPSVGLFHEVGAGKTAALVMGMTELKRRGLISKPVVVVPGHMLEQFSREWSELYPNARLLSAGSDDLRGGSDGSWRSRFAAQVATNDWDGIIMTAAAFEKIGVSEATRSAYIDSQLADMRQAWETMRADEDFEGTRSFKSMQTKMKGEEEKLKQLLPEKHTGGLTFEELGIDYIALDEAHMVKNLHTLSGIPGAEITGSKRAQDMHMKVDYLRGTYGTRVATFATGTPIPNAITEAHVMMRFLRPDLLEDSQTQSFDAWANTFGEQVARIERDAGGRMKQKTRLAKFKNVPEMLAVWHQFADTALTEDLNLDLPEVAPNTDGERRPEMVVIPRSDELGTYMTELTSRLDRLSGRARAGEDNHLSVYTDGKRAALDLRLVDREAGSPNKVDVIGDRIAAIWRETRNREYPVPGTDEMSPNRGGLQLVFCDTSTPNADRWDFYSQLRSDLVTKHRMDRERVAFIHEATNDEQKAAVFRRAREGDLDVLIGSSELMGTGANIQLRAVALHHADCPWRPAELTQREGRILRQGNANAEVEVIRYATEESFDSTMWDTIFRKAAATAQVMRSDFDVRDLEDPGDLAIDAQQLMAAASGNPLVMRKVELDTQVQKLSRRERGHERGQSALRFRKAQAEKNIAHLEKELPKVDAAVERLVDTTGEKFHASIGGREYTKRGEANVALVEQVRTAIRNAGLDRQEADGLGMIGGQPISADWDQHRYSESAQIRFRLGECRLTAMEVSVPFRTTFAAPLSDVPNVVNLLENRIRAIPETAERLRERLAEHHSERDAAVSGLERPFKHREELDRARQELVEVERSLTETNRAPDTAADEDRPVETAGRDTERERLLAWIRARYEAVRQDPTPDAAEEFYAACGEVGISARDVHDALKNQRSPRHEKSAVNVGNVAPLSIPGASAQVDDRGLS